MNGDYKTKNSANANNYKTNLESCVFVLIFQI